MKSSTYKLNVVDLPGVKKIRVTYHYPAWLGLKDEVEDPGGDLRAVEGTKADVAITTDQPLANGILMLDDGIEAHPAQRSRRPADGHRADPEGRPVPHRGAGRRRRRAPQRGLLHRGAARQGAGDQDDPAGPRFQGVADRRSHGRGGGQGRFRPQERRAALLRERRAGEGRAHGRRAARPPPAPAPSRWKISRWSRATWSACTRWPRMRAPRPAPICTSSKRSRSSATTRRSQQAGGGGGGGGDDEDQNQISKRQKEIIAATWNQLKGAGAKGTRRGERGVPGRRAVQTARPGQVAGRPHEGAPVDRGRRFLQELREGHGDGGGGHGSGRRRS